MLKCVAACRSNTGLGFARFSRCSTSYAYGVVIVRSDLTYAINQHDGVSQEWYQQLQSKTFAREQAEALWHAHSAKVCQRALAALVFSTNRERERNIQADLCFTRNARKYLHSVWSMWKQELLTKTELLRMAQHQQMRRLWKAWQVHVRVQTYVPSVSLCSVASLTLERQLSLLCTQ